MPTTNGNRKILDLKRWEFCTIPPTASIAGVCMAMCRHVNQYGLYLSSNSVAHLYSAEEDGYTLLPNPTLTNATNAGTCITAHAWSTGTTVGAASLSATAGTTTSITTNQPLARDLRGYYVFFTGGTNAGRLKVIARNTIGSNAVITFVGAEAVAFDSTSQYRLITPVWYAFGNGTLAANSFRKYDFATNTWISLSNAGAAAPGTDARLISTPSWVDSAFVSFASGTATAGGASTLTHGSANWAANQWANAQVRIAAGTGAGQIRTVSSNTATVLTVSAAWTTQPDATSQFSLEGNDDFLYFIGNNAVTMYRYQISTNTWSTITPTVARGGAPNTGMSGEWVWNCPASDWTDANNIQNGRYIYSYRGASTANLDRYDIAANAWTALNYSPAAELFTLGSKHAYSGEYIYSTIGNTGRWVRYSVATGGMDGWGTAMYTQSTGVAGNTAYEVVYKDGATTITYIHFVGNNLAVALRQMVI